MKHIYRYKKSYSFILTVITSWYLYVYFNPIPWARDLEFTHKISIESNLRVLLHSGWTADEMENKLKNLDWKWNEPRGMYTYKIKFTRLSDDWELIATPSVPYRYDFPLWKRLIYFDSYKHPLPTYKFKKGGLSIYGHRATLPSKD